MGPLSLIIIGYFSSTSLGIPCPVPLPPDQQNPLRSPDSNRQNFNLDETGVLLQTSRRNTSVSCALQLRHLPGLLVQSSGFIVCTRSWTPPPRKKPWLLALRRPLCCTDEEMGASSQCCVMTESEGGFISVFVSVSAFPGNQFFESVFCADYHPVAAVRHAHAHAHTHTNAHTKAPKPALPPISGVLVL